MQGSEFRSGRSSSALLWVLGLGVVAAAGSVVLAARSAAANPLPSPEPAAPLPAPPQPSATPAAEPGFIGPPAWAAPPAEPAERGDDLPPESDPLLPTVSRADFATLWADAYNSGFSYGLTLSPQDAQTKITPQRIFDGMRHALLQYSRAIPEPGRVLSAQEREGWRLYDQGYAQGQAMSASAAGEVVKGEASALGSRDAVAGRPSRVARLRQLEAELGPRPAGWHLGGSIAGKPMWLPEGMMT